VNDNFSYDALAAGSSKADNGFVAPFKQGGGGCC